MGDATKDFLLRIPAGLAEELEQARRAEGLDKTELVLQGLAIRLRALDKTKIDMVLERIGYQRRRGPGRPRGSQAKASSAAVRGNGAGPDGTVSGRDGVAPDGWDLEPEGS